MSRSNLAIYFLYEHGAASEWASGWEGKEKEKKQRQHNEAKKNFRIKSMPGIRSNCEYKDTRIEISLHIVTERFFFDRRKKPLLAQAADLSQSAARHA